jgi:acetoin utilization protein AcuB
MTPSPHSVGRGQPLDVAHAMMRKYGIRHLPVLDGGKLAGILSERDLYFVESVSGTDPRQVKVEEAMSQETYCVRPETPIEEVAMDMADHKYGCAVVMDDGKVAGVFTTTDALHALSKLHAKRDAEQPPVAGATRRGSGG